MITRVPYRVGRLAFVASVVVAMFVLTVSWARAASRGVVVFVTPAGEALDAALRDALSAQLSGGVSDVVFEHFSEDASSLRKQVNEARALSAKYSSQGVFWLDAPVEKDWLLYLAEPSGDRVLVRRITVETEGGAAATEAVAVITSESVNALAHGSTIGMQPVVIPPEPTGPPPVPEIDPFAPPKPVPPPPPRPTGPRGGFASLGYHGDVPAKEVAWQSGARIEIGDRLPGGLFLGAGYTFLREIDIKTPDVSFRVTRTPLDLDFGWVLDRPGFRAGVGVRTIVELLTRENVASVSGLAPLPSSTRPLFRLAPSVRVEQELRRTLSLFIVAGIDVALNPFSFVYQADSGDLALLRPSRVRPMVEAGAVLFL